MKTICFCGTLLLVFSHLVVAQQPIRVAQIAWSMLTPSERAAIQSKYIVDLAAPDTYGVIIDNQGVNESTPGTTGGAALGAAIADASYLDKAFKSGNYSFKNQLASGILGAMLGSTLDSGANAKFHFRYAVRLGNGDIKYFDEIKADAFRHPAGVCVSVPNVALIDQSLCTQSAQHLRIAYLGGESAVPQTIIPLPTYAVQGQSTGSVRESRSSDARVNCKLQNLAPVMTTVEKCDLIGGAKIYE